MSGRAESLADILAGLSVGPPSRGHGIVADDKGRKDKPLPGITEDREPRNYVGRRRRPNRD